MSCRTGEVAHDAHDDTGDINGLMIAGSFGGAVGGANNRRFSCHAMHISKGDVLNSAGPGVAHRLTKETHWMGVERKLGGSRGKRKIDEASSLEARMALGLTIDC